MTRSVRDSVRVGDRIAGEYRVEALLPEGSTSIVARARRGDGLPVALKILHPSLAHEPELVERFRREGRALVRLESEHVVRVLEVIDDPLPILVMELLEGDDLDRVLEVEGPLPVADAVSAVWQACDAIAEAHAHGIVHRDLKPANRVRVGPARAGDVARVKVIDFGIAKTTAGGEPSLTGTDSAMGSPLYMAPEQLRCEPIRFPDAARVDVWGLGVTLYELLVGVTPFEDEVPAMVLAGIFGRPAPPIRPDRPDVPPALESVILRCLEKDRARRWASAAALREALEAFL